MTCISCGSSSNSIIFDNSFLEIPITQCNSCKLIATGESIEQLDKTTMIELSEGTQEQNPRPSHFYVNIGGFLFNCRFLLRFSKHDVL